jgi:hypothetical protein
VDRTLFTATRYSADYGFAPDTLGEDGDPGRDSWSFTRAPGRAWQQTAPEVRQKSGTLPDATRLNRT